MLAKSINGKRNAAPHLTDRCNPLDVVELCDVGKVSCLGTVATFIRTFRAKQDHFEQTLVGIPICKDIQMRFGRLKAVLTLKFLLEVRKSLLLHLRIFKSRSLDRHLRYLFSF